MAPPNPLLTYVYKITPSPPPDPVPEVYPLSALDIQDGFVHLSTASQVPTTADLFFTTHPQIWVVKLRLSRFAAHTTWDDVPGPSGCPHLHGNFGRAEVEASARLVRPDGHTWREALREETFLE